MGPKNVAWGRVVILAEIAGPCAKAEQSERTAPRPGAGSGSGGGIVHKRMVGVRQSGAQYTNEYKTKIMIIRIIEYIIYLICISVSRLT